MSANDLMHDIQKERKTAGEWFLLFLASPLIVYYTIMGVIDFLVETNRAYADKLFLKRIRMTQAEFDQFMHWRIHVQDQPTLPSFEDECEDWFDSPDRDEDFKDEPNDDELRELHSEIHDHD